MRRSDFEERDHSFSSCEVQVKVHSLHGRVLLTNKNQGPKISILSQKCELSQNKQEKAQLPNSTSEESGEVETARALARGGMGEVWPAALRPLGTLNPIAVS